MPDNAVRRGWDRNGVDRVDRVDEKFITGRTGMAPVGLPQGVQLGKIDQDSFARNERRAQRGP